MSTPILGTPSGYQLTRNFFLTECPGRGWPTNITQQVPSPLPTGRRFWTLNRTQTVKPYRFTSSQLLVLRYYDPDGARCEQIGDQALELWLMLPSKGQVQDVEHAGGPVPMNDPTVPDLQMSQITCWVSVMNTQYA
jgi:hypothetical protein